MKYIKEEKKPNIKYRKRPGAYAIMTRDKDDKVGIATDGRNLFYLGGGIEEGETKLQALKREFIEETGYTIKNIKSFDEVRSFIEGAEKEHLEVEAYVYTAEFDEKVAEPIEKDHKVLWANPEEYKDKLFREWQKYILKEYVERNCNK